MRKKEPQLPAADFLFFVPFDPDQGGRNAADFAVVFA